MYTFRMSKNYFVTVGLEIHAELKTKTKMFCACKNDPNETKPNINICPVCMAHPGALPVANKEAVKQVIRVGLAVNGTIANFSEFDRKSYYYPDIPKGYQISQYKFPIVSGGRLADFALTRIHLEEDTGGSKHDRGDFSLVDFNRAGMPLMELVTNAQTFAAKTSEASSVDVSAHVEQSAAEVAGMASAKFAREYQLLLWYLGASEANMEKGEMRVEANISVTTDPAARTDSPENNPKAFGTKVEVKNLNSVRSAERAIKYEAARMIDLIEKGEGNSIIQETRGWDEQKQVTFSQRTKEEAQDYRYFPDPDLPKMKLHELFNLESLQADLPELPVAKRARYRADFGIKDEDIESYINDVELGAWFEKVASILQDPAGIKIASNYVTSDLLGIKKSTPTAQNPSAEHFAELISMVTSGDISSRAAKDILAKITAGATASDNQQSPKQIAEAEGLLQKNDEGALREIAAKVITDNPAVVATYKAGKENAIMSLVGCIMKETKGSANPQLVQKILKELL